MNHMKILALNICFVFVASMATAQILTGDITVSIQPPGYHCKDGEILVTRVPVQVSSAYQLSSPPLCVPETAVRNADVGSSR
jgi:hypothetical protein